MEEKIQHEVTTKDVLKHYLSSIFIYGVILLFIAFCPLLNKSIENEYFNYITFFLIYYIAYVIFALPIFMKFKPQSILESRSVAVIDYIKRQFKRNETTEEWLKNIEPKENEKQSMMILFMKTFFGVYCVNLLCNKYLPALGYDIDFLREMFMQAMQYAESSGLYMGLAQYIDDSADMWLTIIFTITTSIFALSYLTDLDLFGNKIKTVDTTPLGVLSCIMCYYPMTLLTNKLIVSYADTLVPVDNFNLRIILNILIVAVNIGALIAIARLGTKSGNLTNRGIITGFPYNIIRHPNYSMQMCYIILTSIPIYLMNDFSFFEKILITAGIFIWLYIYYLRSITEERHLIKDPQYQEYVEKVKYRFIPKII